LATTQNLLNEYFDKGSGSSLSEEEQSIVTAGARRLVFAWTKLRLFGVEDLGRDQTRVLTRLEKEFQITLYYEISGSMDHLPLTGYRRAGLGKRAWVLVEKVIPLFGYFMAE